MSLRDKTFCWCIIAALGLTWCAAVISKSTQHELQAPAQQAVISAMKERREREVTLHLYGPCVGCDGEVAIAWPVSAIDWEAWNNGEIVLVVPKK